MRILSVSLKNFASYDDLDFQMTDQGLTLISGPTGSGKSTLMDAVPWVLFGITAKGGAVSEVLSWPGDKVVKGRVIVDLPAGYAIEVTRMRGKTAKDNDLYYSLYDSKLFDPQSIIPNPRGKDIPDTQKLINQQLGLTPELYLSAAYFHEFSQTAQFFVTTAKGRRAITEQIVDLSLPIKLQANIKTNLKDLNSKQFDLEGEVKLLEGKIATLTKFRDSEAAKSDAWSKIQEAKEQNLKEKFLAFETDKEKRISDLNKMQEIWKAANDTNIKSLTEMISFRMGKLVSESSLNDSLLDTQAKIESHKNKRCSACGAPTDHSKVEQLQKTVYEIKGKIEANKRLTKEIEDMEHELAQIVRGKNPYPEQIVREKANQNLHDIQLKDLKLEANPHYTSHIAIQEDISNNTAEKFVLTYSINSLKSRIEDLELLNKVAVNLRSNLIQNTIVSLEDTTNDLLTKHFDAEIRVTFVAQDADKLEVEIAKDGNTCVYSQLSKGQRQLLKLCFGISVMKSVSNHHGIKFHQIFFDEALDGLDANMKVKAVGLLQSLETEYESVFVVEHSGEVKSMIDNQYAVSLVNGRSQIEKS